MSGQVVVAAAILDGARVLVAQRRGPGLLAGRWELPGGKVDADETDEQALLRECREELGVELMLGRRVGRDWPIDGVGVLRVWLATIVCGQPELREHAAFAWLGADELHDLDWLPADVAIAGKLAALMLDLTT